MEKPYLTFRKSRGGYTETDPFSVAYIYAEGEGFEHFGTALGSIQRIKDGKGSKAYRIEIGKKTLPNGREIGALDVTVEDYEKVKPAIIHHLIGQSPTLSITENTPDPMSPVIEK